MKHPQCRAKFELANGEFVSRCHLDLGQVIEGMTGLALSL
jgi:hypothetical protein